MATYVPLKIWKRTAVFKLLKKLCRHNYRPVTWQQSRRFFIGDVMNDKEFKQMLDELVSREEKRLQVNSEEFNRRHEDIMELIQKARLGEMKK